MVSDTSCDYRSEDKKLQVGKPVKAYWCKDGFYYQGEGVITQLGRDNVIVQLKKRVAWSDEYKIGRNISLPRVTNSIHWNTRNCVRLIQKELVPA